MYTVKVELLQARLQLQANIGREVDWREIAASSNVHENTLYAILRGESQARVNTLQKLVTGFRKLGHEDLSIHDILVEENSEDFSPEAATA